MKNQDELPLPDAIEKWLEEKGYHNFEGDSGLEKLEHLFKTIGYRTSGFRFGTLIEGFLADNPGAVESIIEWMKTLGNKDWRDRLVDDIEGIEEEIDPTEDEEDVDMSTDDFDTTT